MNMGKTPVKRTEDEEDWGLAGVGGKQDWVGEGTLHLHETLKEPNLFI